MSSQVIETRNILLLHVLFVQISKKSIDYIPFRKAIVLSGKGSDDAEIKEEVEKLEKTVKETFSSLNQRYDALVVSHVFNCTAATDLYFLNSSLGSTA